MLRNHAAPQHSAVALVPRHRDPSKRVNKMKVYENDFLDGANTWDGQHSANTD